MRFKALLLTTAHKRAANQWIAYVDSEIKRRDLMKQDVPDYQPRERDDLLDVLEEQQQ